MLHIQLFHQGHPVGRLHLATLGVRRESDYLAYPPHLLRLEEVQELCAQRGPLRSPAMLCGTVGGCEWQDITRDYREQ